MSDTEDTIKPKRPARDYNPNRRATPSEYKRTIKALRKALRKEERRTEKVDKLKDKIAELSGKLNSLRNAHIR